MLPGALTASVCQCIQSVLYQLDSPVWSWTQNFLSWSDCLVSKCNLEALNKVHKHMLKTNPKTTAFVAVCSSSTRTSFINNCKSIQKCSLLRWKVPLYGCTRDIIGSSQSLLANVNFNLTTTVAGRNVNKILRIWLEWKILHLHIVLSIYIHSTPTLHFILHV